jgi:hypothetical protein
VKIDPGTFRIVIVGLIVLAIAAVVSAVVLTIEGYDAGQAWMLATGGLTGLVGLLVNPSTEVAPGFDPGGAAVEGYRAATQDIASLVPARRARGTGGRVDLVVVGVFLVLLAVAYLIAHEAGAF